MHYVGRYIVESLILTCVHSSSYQLGCFQHCCFYSHEQVRIPYHPGRGGSGRTDNVIPMATVTQLDLSGDIKQ